MADLFKTGGTAGISTYCTFSDTGVLTISDGISSSSWTPGGAISVIDLTVTGTTTIGNAASDTMTITGHVDLDSDRTSAGSGLDIDGRINSASAAFSSLDITAVQLTTARSSGAVNGAKLATTSLAGDSGGTYSDLRLAAPTDGGGSATHNAITVEAGHDALIDASAAATGQNDIVVPDNVASALEIREGSTTYLTVQTTNNAEAVVLGRRVVSNVTTVTMAASPHSLVYGTATGDQTQVVGNSFIVSAGGASRVLRLPPTADSANFELRVYNGGSDAFEIASSTGTTIVASVPVAKGVMLGCNGSGWGYILSA